MKNKKTMNDVGNDLACDEEKGVEKGEKEGKKEEKGGKKESNAHLFRDGVFPRPSMLSDSADDDDGAGGGGVVCVVLRGVRVEWCVVRHEFVVVAVAVHVGDTHGGGD